MPFDGYFKGDKVVRPPSRHPPNRPYKPPRRLPNPLNPTNKPRPRPLPKPSLRPSIPQVEQGVGTAVPTTPHPTVAGLRRSTQFLRWFRPIAFDNWGYIESFSYVLDPIINKDPDVVSLPPGWRQCGKLEGEMIPLGRLDISNPDQPFLCNLVPVGGQIKPEQIIGPEQEWYMFFNTTWVPAPGVEFGTANGLIWKPNGVPSTPRPTRGVQTYAAQDHAGPEWLGVPRPRAGSRPRTVPFDLQPDQPVAPHPTMGPTRYYKFDPFGAKDVTTADKPGDKPWAPENPHKPPPRRTKERKGAVPRWFARLSRVAWEATEAVDVVDNLFECLPKAVRKKAPKTGVTLPDAWKPGIKYTSVIDRAKHVYNNADKLDLDCAMRKLTCNHIMDMLWGRFFGGVDDAARKAGVTGFGQANSSMSGLYVTKEQKAAFDKWIKENPALDSLRKSLDCENLGRS